MGLEALKAKMQALGMRPTTRTDGTLEGLLVFHDLVNAFTQSAILSATVRNQGHDAILCVSPAHLAHLPAIRILDIPDAPSLERHVQQLYQRRLERLREVNQFLSTLGLNASLDEPGFRVTAETWVGSDTVKFTVRPGQVVQVIAISGRDLEVAIDAKERRVDARKVGNTRELEAVLAPLVARLKAPRRPPAPKFDPMSVVALIPPSPARPPVVEPPPEPPLELAPRGGTQQIGPPPSPAARRAGPREFDESDFASSPESAGPPPSSTGLAPGSMREGAEMFDHAFAGFQDEDTFGEIEQPPPADRAPATSASPAAAGQILALVCGECGGFYLLAENPPDVRLLDTCPTCLSRA